MVVVLGCRPKEGAQPKPLTARYPIRKHVQWTEKRERSGVVTSRLREETWTPVLGKRDTWDVVTKDRGAPEDAGEAPEAEGVFHARYALLKDGLAQISVFEGPIERPTTPPKVTLPKAPAPGFSWASEHKVGSVYSRRICKIASSPCPDGIEVQCTTTFADGRTVEVKNRFCGGVGQVSYASATLMPKSDEPIRVWSEDLVDIP